MLSLFVSKCICDYYVSPSGVIDSDKALFDVKIQQKNQFSKYSFTEQVGFYSAFKIYDPKREYVSDLNYITANKKEISVDGVVVKSTITGSSDNLNIYVQFEVTNNNYWSRKIDLGFYAQPKVQGGKIARVANYKDRGMKVIGRPTNGADFTYTIVTNKFNYPDLTGYYFAQLGDQVYNSPADYPYWKTGPSTDTDFSKPVELAFHYANQTIRGHETITLGFVITGETTSNFAPFVEDITERKNFYSPNEEVDIKIAAYNWEDEDVTVTLELPDGRKFTNKSRANPVVYLTQKVNIGSDSKFTFSYYAEDHPYNKKSITRTSYFPISEPPSITITTEPLKNYSIGETIRVAGKVSDDAAEVQIRYQIDKDGAELTINKTDVTPEGVIFDVNFEVPKAIFAGEHVFRIWAIDAVGVSSLPKEFNFNLNTPNIPTFLSTFVSTNVARKGDKIVLFGELTDKDTNQNLSIFIRFGENGKREYLGSIISTDERRPFAFFYTVPENAPAKYNIIFEAIDDTEQRSEGKNEVSIRVRDPSEPDPTPSPRPAKLVETNPTSPDACFDLTYEEKDQQPKSITYNNEGFFVGYRVYDKSKSKTSETYLVKKSESQTSSNKNITVSFSTQHDEASPNFVNLVFSVTNNGYFTQRIDLGVFADSFFGGDDNNPIKFREDKLGFIVSGNERHYTVLTRNFLDHKNIDNTFIGQVDKKQVTVNKYPFFDDSESKASTSDQNAMYAFSWVKQDIPPDTTVKFAVAFAADEYIPTPSFISDRTYYPDWVLEGDSIKFTVDVADSDIDQNIVLDVYFNGEKNSTMYEVIPGQTKFTFTQNVKIPEGIYFNFTAICHDELYRWASNRIEKIIPLIDEPRFGVYSSSIRERQFTSQPISMQVGASSPSVKGYIKYQFDDARIVKYAELQADAPEVRKYLTIEFPSELEVRDWHTFTIWAENELGQKSMQVITYRFLLREENPPKLVEAGLSVQAATAGSSIVGYVILADKEDNENLKLYATYNDEDHFISKFKSHASDTPYGFFFNVPTEISGNQNIVFYVEDEDLLRSENYPVRLYIQ